MLLRRTALKGLAIAGLGQALTLPWSAAQAQTTYPSKPVRVLTPFPAGAGPDAAMRVIGEQLGRKWGQSVVIDNRPGGNGFIAISAFKNAADSHSLLLIDSSHATVHPLTYSQLPYDVQKDLQPIGMILRTPFFIAVAADSPYRSLEDIVAAANGVDCFSAERSEFGLNARTPPIHGVSDVDGVAFEFATRVRSNVAQLGHVGKVQDGLADF